MNKIKGVCFDLDGVYFTPQSFPKVRSDLAVNSGEDKAEEVFHKSKEITQFKKGEITEEEFLRYASKELNMEINADDMLSSFSRCYEVNDEVHKTVLRARELGLKTCICSNNFVTRIKSLDYAFGFLQHFDVKIFSYEVGVLKPDRRIFEELVRQSEIEPEEIVYSDDSADKLAGAKELGINTFVYESFDQFKSELEKLGVEL